MTNQNQTTEPLDPNRFSFWTPPEDRVVEVGPEQEAISLPQIQLPIHRGDLAGDEPSDDAIGRGLYDYLRQFPDCPLSDRYAALLRDVYPYYLAEVGAQAAMLAHKVVDAPYVQRKITCLKILALLDPANPGLQQQIGISFFELATMFSELPHCRRHLLSAMGHLQNSLKGAPADLTSLNVLAQIDFLFGDYPSAARRWSGVVERLDGGPAKAALNARLQRIDAMKFPDHPLINDLEAVGEALVAFSEKDFNSALSTLERLEEEDYLPAEMPMAEFHYLLGLCRLKTGDSAGAFASFERALEIDPEFEPAQEGRDAVLDGRDI